MRVTALLSALLMLPLSTAHGAIQFLGHGTNATGVIARGDWSSDLGPPWVASRPIPHLSQGVVIEADTGRSLSGGRLDALSRITIAPAGPATAASPVFVYEGQLSAQNLGDLYGRFAAASHSACLLYTPPGAASTVYYAVRWTRTVASSGSSVNDYLVATPFQQIAWPAQSDSGTHFGTLAGTSSGLCNFAFNLSSGVGSLSVGSVAQNLRVEIYLDSSPVAGADAPVARGAVLLAPRPNPGRGPAALTYTLPEAGDVRLAIVDVSGRTVRELENGPREAGLTSTSWDGRDAQGQRVAAGLYFATLTVGNHGGITRRRQSVVLMP